MKILSPAGNLESLNQAVLFGCDEVYLGVNQFNARNNIDGFTLETLEQAVDFCHLFGVKVNLAVNILFTDSELVDAFNLCLKAFNLGVDHFIVQDLGLAHLINKHLPSAVLHASTQMAVHNLEGVNALLPYGFKRIVLARETPLEEIKRIKQNTNVEIEYFVHGALCVSFSGNCYLSSYLNDASGNRGKCKQLCRLPYSLYLKDKKLLDGYLLSAKDINMSNKLAQLQDAGVDILKIEGRARRPYYVGSITNYYRQLLNGKSPDKTSVLLAFNRGFTSGYFDGNDKIISTYQAHAGINIGKITKVNFGKNFNQVYFTSNRELHPKSTFKIFNNGVEQAVVTAYDLKVISPSLYMFTTTAKLANNDSINLIQDAFLETQTAEIKPKRDIKICICAKQNLPITATFEIDGKEISVYGETLSSAKNLPLSRKEVVDNFAKGGVFNCEITFSDFESVFIPKSQLNKFRREVLDAVFSALTKPYKRDLTAEIDLQQEVLSCGKVPNCLTDFVIIKDFSNLKDIKQANIIYSPENYDLNDIICFQKECEKHKKVAILDLPNFALQQDICLLENIIKRTNITFVANNYYALTFKGDMIIGGGLNIYNSLSASLLKNKFLSAEMPCNAKIDFPLMTLRHCPYKNHLGANCKNCPHQNGYYLKMQSGKKLYISRKKLSTCTFYLSQEN